MNHADFAGNIYNQFDAAMVGGIREFEVVIPVVSLGSNRMTLGADVSGLPKAPHLVTLRRHPTGVILTSIESRFGMACPDPLPSPGVAVAELPQDVISGPEVRRHAGLIILSSTTKLTYLGAGFDDGYAQLAGLDESERSLFAAQIAGVSLKRMRQLPPASA